MDSFFNPGMLSIARKIREVTQTDLCKTTKISQAHLSKIEQGFQIPTEEHIKTLSDTLDFPFDFFSISNQYLPTMTPLHRKRMSLSKKIQEHCEALANLKRIHTEKLLEKVSIPYLLPSPSLNEPIQPEKTASNLRALLQIPKGPIDTLVSLLETQGLFIFLEPFPTVKLTGFSLIGEQTRPIAFINKSAPGDMERLTIAHELGHILMHRFASDSAEDEAWSFATEFLMPRSDILPDLRKARKLADFARLKQKWKVSMAALIGGSHKLGLLTDNQYRYFMQGMAPYRTNEPVHIPQEVPTLFDSLLERYITMGYSLENLAAELAVTPALFKELYEKI